MSEREPKPDSSQPVILSLLGLVMPEEEEEEEEEDVVVVVSVALFAMRAACFRTTS